METVYPPESYPATEPIDMKNYFKGYQEQCKVTEFSADKDAFDKRAHILREEFNLPFSSDDLRELEALCTTDKLKVSKENPKLPLTKIPKNVSLPETHPITEEARALRTVKTKEELNALRDNLQIDIKSFGIWLVDDEEDVDCVKDVRPGSTFIYRVQIFVPFNTLLGHKLTMENVRVQYEIEVLSTNSLLDLANAIKCVSDTFTTKEVADMNVDWNAFKNANEHYPSRCFFIENTFYNDMSHPNAIDYSEVVRKWGLEKNIGNFKCESMEGASFDSLKPRLGYGYVYIHQGNCEHIVCFTDAKLVQNTDCLVSSKYPKMISMKREVNYLCFICSENHSCWMIINSNRLPVRKAFFCTRCCESYMFLDGKKVGDFELYPYYAGVTTSEAQAARTEQDDIE